MLNKIFGTKNREKILKYFLLHADKSFNFRQIMDNLKLPQRTVKTELTNLSKFGILFSFEKKQENLALAIKEDKKTVEKELKTNFEKNKKDKENGFIKSIKTEKSKKELKKIKEENSFYQINKDFILYEEIRALIFKAQILYEKDFALKLSELGNLKLLIFTGFFVNNTDSPVDLFVVGDLNKDKLFSVILDLEKDLGREVNFTVMDESEFKYRSEITDVFLYQVLDGRKIISVNKIGVV